MEASWIVVPVKEGKILLKGKKLPEFPLNSIKSFKELKEKIEATGLKNPKIVDYFNVFFYRKKLYIAFPILFEEASKSFEAFSPPEALNIVKGHQKEALRRYLGFKPLLIEALGDSNG